MSKSSWSRSAVLPPMLDELCVASGELLNMPAGVCSLNTLVRYELCLVPERVSKSMSKWEAQVRAERAGGSCLSPVITSEKCSVCRPTHHSQAGPSYYHAIKLPRIYGRPSSLSLSSAQVRGGGPNSDEADTCAARTRRQSMDCFRQPPSCADAMTTTPARSLTMSISPSPSCTPSVYL